MAQWIGYMVSIKCANDLGTFQGEIQSATNSVICLTKAFCNGFPCAENPVVIKGSEIVDLKLIEKQSSSQEERSIITIAKPIAKRAGRTQSTSESNNTSLKISNGPHTKSKPIDIEPQKGTNSHFDLSSNSFKNNTPNKRDRRNKRDEECFSSPLDDQIKKEFDFEKNLALFNKEAVWCKLNVKKQKNYKHNENVIASAPTTYSQISVPLDDISAYVTDEGLIIPSITRFLRKKLWTTADEMGLTFEKRAELMGRAAAEMSIQLIGGGHRLHPRNTHQWPTVVVFCGPNSEGAVGINAARQLASQGITTIVYAVSQEVNILKSELQLYRLTKNRVVSDVKNLPFSADLIIVALCEESEQPKAYPEIASWVESHKAPVLALDPPSVGMTGFSPKYSLLSVLPLSHSTNNGKLYLCNLGFPVEIFSQVGIKYKSPFAGKFVIALHPKDN